MSSALCKPAYTCILWCSQQTLSLATIVNYIVPVGTYLPSLTPEGVIIVKHHGDVTGGADSVS